MNTNASLDTLETVAKFLVQWELMDKTAKTSAIVKIMVIVTMRLENAAADLDGQVQNVRLRARQGIMAWDVFNHVFVSTEVLAVQLMVHVTVRKDGLVLNVKKVSHSLTLDL